MPTLATHRLPDRFQPTSLVTRWRRQGKGHAERFAPRSPSLRSFVGQQGTPLFVRHQRRGTLWVLLRIQTVPTVPRCSIPILRKLRGFVPLEQPPVGRITQQGL